ncbi:MAG: putative transposase, partial [Planctomycetota bacterium]
MALQTSIPGAVPPAARIVSTRLAILFDEERLVVYSAADPIYTCRRDDQDGLRLAAGMLSHLKLADDTAIAGALGINRETVRRNRNLLSEGGVDAIRSQRTGPKGAFKLTEDVRSLAQGYIDEGWSVRRTARELGLSEGALRYASRQGKLSLPTQRRGATSQDLKVHARGGLGPAERAAEDQACERGVGVKRTAERTLACTGKLAEALPVFQAAEAVPGAGVLLALPSLLDQGLIEVGQDAYGSLRNAYYGLRSVLLTFCFMALLRIKTPEQLTSWAPGELGLLLGLDRAPEVK